MNKLVLFIKKEFFLFILFILLIIFSILNPINIVNYISYIDWKSITVLMGLLIITTGIKESNYFYYIAKNMLSRFNNEKKLAIFLILLSLILSTFLTNDITLFIVIPLTMSIKNFIKNNISKFVIFETLSVNIGSSLTPIGNPQNLFLWHKWNIGFFLFIFKMLPLVIILIIILLIFAFIVFPDKDFNFLKTESFNNNHNNNWFKNTANKDENCNINNYNINDTNNYKNNNINIYKNNFNINNKIFLNKNINILNNNKNIYNKNLFIYSSILLIIFLILLIFKFPFLALPFIFIFYISFFKNVIKKTDWMLLITFILIFIDFHIISNFSFIIKLFKVFNLNYSKDLFLISSFSPQFISNVPAAVLLSKFSHNWIPIVYGVNIGGNGFVIGSLANIISLRIVKSNKIWINFHKYSLFYFFITFSIFYILFFLF